MVLLPQNIELISALDHYDHHTRLPVTESQVIDCKPRLQKSVVAISIGLDHEKCRSISCRSYCDLYGTNFAR